MIVFLFPLIMGEHTTFIDWNKKDTLRPKISAIYGQGDSMKVNHSIGSRVGIIIILFIVCIAMTGTVEGRKPTESSPIQITTDPHYDRNPSIFQGKAGNYWLFFTRGNDDRGIRDYEGYNPDYDYYTVWYKTAKKLADLQNAPEYKLPKDPPYSTAQRDVAALQTNDGRIWVFTSPGYGPEDTSNNGIRAIHYYILDKYKTWTGPFSVLPGSYNGCGIGHIDVTENRGKLWLFYDECYRLKVTGYDPSIGIWSDPVLINPTATLGKAIVAKGNFYVVWVYLNAEQGSWGPGIYISTSRDGKTWLTGSEPVAAWGEGLTNWDPVIINDKNEFRILWAPSDTEQFIAMTSSATPSDPSSWSSPLRVTSAASSGNYWWDFWPEAIKSGSKVALFYSSERSPDGTSRSDGNIWLIPSIPL